MVLTGCEFLEVIDLVHALKHEALDVVFVLVDVLVEGMMELWHPLHHITVHGVLQEREGAIVS